MSYATKFNKGSKFTFKTADDPQYVSLEVLYNKNPDQIHDVKALYINTKSRFGDAPCVAIDPVIIVNLPNHLLDTVKERIEEFKEHNNLTTDPHDELICNTNSDNALPDELSKQDGVPISTSVTDGIHVGDETNNEELISSHNSERAIEDKPITTNTEEISVISTVNSSKFVDESLN